VPSYEYETNHFRPTSHQEGAGFYFQFNNADILYGNNKVAGWRTCNITCIAMILESLGIGKDSTKDNIDKNVLAKLAEFYRAKLGNKTLSNLRYPDFLQLLAIYLKLKNASGLDPGVIGRARDAAARSITDWSFMKEMTTSFNFRNQIRFQQNC